jgi:glutamine---fructose-6-phosphate transaminase (isomerizing)
MSQPGQHTYHEIITQPDAWAEAIHVGQSATPALQALWARLHPRTILFSGCGSTYYLSLAAAALARGKGLAAVAAPGSEVWLLTKDVVLQPEQTLFVAVSRSGETSETLRAIDAFRQACGAAVIVVTCYPESAMAKKADLLLAAPAGQERSVAQTRSFASMLLLCRMLVGAFGGEKDASSRLATLPDLGRRLIGAYGDLTTRLGNDMALQRFFFLGNGPLYGLACEAMLKMKEMSLSYSEAYHTLELRHGPKSMADSSALVIGLLSQKTSAQELAVLSDVQALGAHTLAITDAGADLTAGAANDGIYLQSGLSPDERMVLYLPVLQLLAYQRAMAKGLDPDGPRNLTAVVTL